MSAHIPTFLAAAFTWQSMLLPLGLVLILTSLMFSIRKKRARQHSLMTPHETLEKLRQNDGVRGDMEKIMVEVEQMARRVGAQLDAKAIRLERLIDEADRKLAQLDERTNGASSTSAARGNGDYGRLTHQAGGAVASAQRDDTWARGNEATSTSGAGGVSGGASGGVNGDALTRSVHSLREQGLNPIQIAKQLGEHVGKVELILSLGRA